MPQFKSNNPLEKLLNQLSGPWTMYILCVLDKHGVLRFGELRRQVEGISPKVLTDRLRMLETIGLVQRDYQPTIPPIVTYQLTERGKELSQPLYHLYDLADSNTPKATHCVSQSTYCSVPVWDP
jgi:DNA-binding HxlR family transcriptional regulator